MHETFYVISFRNNLQHFYIYFQPILFDVGFCFYMFPASYLSTAQSLDMRMGEALSASQPSIAPHHTNMGPPTSTGIQSNTLRRKAPAPPPPSYMIGHNRNTSDPGLNLQLTHMRTGSDSTVPPPLPAKTGVKMAGEAIH